MTTRVLKPALEALRRVVDEQPGGDGAIPSQRQLSACDTFRPVAAGNRNVPCSTCGRAEERHARDAIIAGGFQPIVRCCYPGDTRTSVMRGWDEAQGDERGPILAAWAVHERSERDHLVAFVRALEQRCSNLEVELVAARKRIGEVGAGQPRDERETADRRPADELSPLTAEELAEIETRAMDIVSAPAGFESPDARRMAGADVPRLVATVRALEQRHSNLDDVLDGVNRELIEIRYLVGAERDVGAGLAVQRALRERDEEIARLRVVVAALPTCTECSTRPATLADRGPDAAKSGDKPPGRRATIERLLTAWDRLHTLRLGQLIVAACESNAPPIAAFSVSDEELVELIEGLAAKLSHPESTPSG